MSVMTTSLAATGRWLRRGSAAENFEPESLRVIGSSTLYPSGPAVAARFTEPGAELPDAFGSVGEPAKIGPAPANQQRIARTRLPAGGLVAEQGISPAD